MENFAAIDFETANDTRSSVSSVVVVRNGIILEKFYSLINPFLNYYEDWATDLHGLTPEDTDSAPIFPDVWEKIEPLIFKVSLLWLITNSLMKPACEKFSENIKWYTLNTNSDAPCKPLARN